MTITYRDKVFTVEQTGNEREPYRLVGKRGGALTLVRTGSGRSLFWVRLPSGRIQGGYVGQLRDGRLIHLPQSGAQAHAAQMLYREQKAA